MMGQQSRAEWLFYYFRFGRADPQRSFTANNRPLRRLRFRTWRAEGLLQPTGRSSIDPEVPLRLLLVGYLDGIASKRR